jgi:hypothetical protein
MAAVRITPQTTTTSANVIAFDPSKPKRRGPQRGTFALGQEIPPEGPAPPNCFAFLRLGTSVEEPPHCRVPENTSAAEAL